MAKKRPTKSSKRVSTSLTKSALMRRIEASKAKKLNLYEKHKNEYVASPLPGFVRVGPAMYLAYDGRGKPGAPDFSAGIAAMYSVAFTMKMAFKSKGRDYAVTKLEALWWRDGDTRPPTLDTVWNWSLIIRVPPYITAADVASTSDSLVAK